MDNPGSTTTTDDLPVPPQYRPTTNRGAKRQYLTDNAVSPNMTAADVARTRLNPVD